MGLTKAKQGEGDSAIIKYYHDVLVGEVVEDENLLVEALGNFRDLIPFLKKDFKFHSNKKRWSQDEYL